MKLYKDHMVSCPKCGGYSIGGPKYKRDVHKECMVWSCRDCGYTENTQCIATKTESKESESGSPPRGDGRLLRRHENY